MKRAPQTARGAAFGPSATALSGGIGGAGVGLKGIPLPKEVQVHIEPGAGVTTAYAVVRRRAD